MLMLISWEVWKGGWTPVLEVEWSVHRAFGIQVKAGGLQGGATALSLWEALVVSVQTQVLHCHQLTCKHEAGTCKWLITPGLLTTRYYRHIGVTLRHNFPLPCFDLNDTDMLIPKGLSVKLPAWITVIKKSNNCHCI